MTHRFSLLALSLLLFASVAVPSFADDDARLKKDMTSVIALQGFPCGQVVAVTANGENDYTCRCQDGNRYRVYINAAGRVVVENVR